MGVFIAILGGAIIGGALGSLFGPLGLLIAAPLCIGWGYLAAMLFPSYRKY